MSALANSRFTFIHDTHSSATPDEISSVIKHEIYGEQLDDIVMYIDDFLKGCGYVYDGKVCIVDTKGNVHTNPERSLEPKALQLLLEDSFS